MTKPKTIEPAAPEQLTAPDAHAYVGALKASVAKKYSLTRMAALFEIVDVAWYFTALDRAKDARALADHIAERVIFSGNHNIWSATAKAITLAARHARLDADKARRKTLIKRLVEHSAYAVVPRSAIEAALARDSKSIAESRQEKSKKTACSKLSRALMGICYFRESAGSGFYYDKWIDTAALDREIESGLRLLRERLDGR